MRGRSVRLVNEEMRTGKNVFELEQEQLKILPKNKNKKSEKDYSTYFQGPSMIDGKKRKTVAEHIQYALDNGFRDMGKGKYYKILTYGCQMNEHDTEVMAGIFMQLGYTPTEVIEEADVVLLNTCAIRENAENKVFGELGFLLKYKRKNPEMLIGVCGCMSQEESVVNKILRSYPHVDMVFGTHNIHRLPNILKEAYMSKEMVIEVWSKEGDVIENLPKKRLGSIKAWVNIMYGCDKFCTYCIVPYTRGKERSRRPEEIIAEVRELAAAGYKEIMLLGQNVNAYGKDFEDIDYRLGDLMDELRKIDIPRIRFTTSHPRDFDDHLIEVLAKRGNLVEHIHLPVQSGSNDVLKIMARKYTREHFLGLVDRIKAAIPEVTLTTDIIVGYPNETEEQFEETLSLYREVGFDAAFTYIYSPREGTPAAKMIDNVPEEVKKERLQRLNEVVGEYSRKALERLNGQVVEVLVEGTSKRRDDVLAGYTRKNRLVNFKAPAEVIGQLVKVKITETTSYSLTGEFLEVVKNEKVEA